MHYALLHVFESRKSSSSNESFNEPLLNTYVASDRRSVGATTSTDETLLSVLADCDESTISGTCEALCLRKRISSLRRRFSDFSKAEINVFTADMRFKSSPISTVHSSRSNAVCDDSRAVSAYSKRLRNKYTSLVRFLSWSSSSGKRGSGTGLVGLSRQRFTSS